MPCRLEAVGRGAQTIYRDRVTGKTVTKEEFAKTREKGKKQKTKEEEAGTCLFVSFTSYQLGLDPKPFPSAKQL